MSQVLKSVSLSLALSFAMVAGNQGVSFAGIDLTPAQQSAKLAVLAARESVHQADFARAHAANMAGDQLVVPVAAQENYAVTDAGKMLPDGSINAGVASDTRNAGQTAVPFYAAASDASRVMTFGDAVQYCASLDANSHQDWRLPSKQELAILYLNQGKGALQGQFNLSGVQNSAGFYWSSTPARENDAAWGQGFNNRQQSVSRASLPASVRCVRN